jgi:hypothetical protein
MNQLIVAISLFFRRMPVTALSLPQNLRHTLDQKQSRVLGMADSSKIVAAMLCLQALLGAAQVQAGSLQLGQPANLNVSARSLMAPMQSSSLMICVASVLRGPQSKAGTFAPMLAQVDPKAAAKSFLDFLTIVLILLAVCLVAVGGIYVAQGRYTEGLAAIVGGFIAVLAVPIIYYFAKLAGITF